MDAYRPDSAFHPIVSRNIFLRLPVLMSPLDGNFSHAVNFGHATWRGYFDASYTKVGDYLVDNDQIWFIIAQQSLLPIQCVRTNAIISVTRRPTPAIGSSAGIVMPTPDIPLITNWPASVLTMDVGTKPPTALPADIAASRWTVLLPSCHGRFLQSSDMMTDERGRKGMILSAEQSEYGWRMSVQQVTT